MAVVSLGADIFTHNAGRAFGRDFTNAWVGGRLALDGQAWCAFDVNCFRLRMHEYLDVLNLQNYSYPPHTMFLDAPFALVPYYPALALWTLLGCLFFIWAARSWLPKGFPPVLAILTPAALLNIWNGHYGFILGGLWLLCFRYLKTQPARSGVMAGLLTFKPHLGALVAVAMLTNRKALVAAIGTALILILASAAIFGTDTWAAFIHSTTAEQADVLTRSTGDFYFWLMPSAYVGFGQGAVGIAAQIIFAGAAIVMLGRRPTVDPFVYATATFLIVPYVMNYDMTVACLGFAILLWSRWGSLSFLERVILSLAFLSPELTYIGGWAVPFFLLGALWVQLCHLVNEDVAEVIAHPGQTGVHAMR